MKVHDLISAGQDSQAIEYLKQHPKELEFRDDQGLNLLHYAVFFQREQVLDYLLEKKSKLIKGKSVQGNTPLHFAARFGNKVGLNITKKLLQSKAKCNAQNKDGNTALHVAASKGKYLQVRMLVQAGASTQIENTHSLIPERLANKQRKKALEKDEINKHLRYKRIQDFLSHEYLDSKASDTDSEDAEDYDFQAIRPRVKIFPVRENKEIKETKEMNEKTEVKKAKKKEAEEGEALVSHFRGSHFYQEYFDRPQRRNAKLFHQLQKALLNNSFHYHHIKA